MNLVALLLFSFGVVVAIWSEDWWSRPGRTMSVAGAFVLLVAAVGSYCSLRGRAETSFRQPTL